jgi:hypothetical protein
VERLVSYLWKEPEATGAYKTGVSLHGHTNHSKESLCFISEFASEIAPLRWALAQQERRALRKGGVRVDFLNGYWVPPLSPRTAYELESSQIGETLELASLVSLTDHDSIEAPLRLRMLPASAQTPISLEWSVPYREVELHLGIHNLPPKQAPTILAELAGYTARPQYAKLPELLAELHRWKEVLVVLNHPMWDLCHTGEAHHKQALMSFMASCGQYVHALELGGLRGWEENQRTVNFAAGWNEPVISGGDRHGSEPNACVNLTNAATFAEFVDEVRHGRSHVLFMPQYADPLASRIIRVINEVVRRYPENPVGSRWDDRVYHPDREGVERPLSQLWEKPPAYIGAVFSVLRLFESTALRRAAQALGRPEQQLHLTWTGDAS